MRQTSSEHSTVLLACNQAWNKGEWHINFFITREKKREILVETLAFRI